MAAGSVPLLLDFWLRLCLSLTLHCLSLAVERFEELLLAEPNDTVILNNYATILLHVPPLSSPLFDEIGI